jgi:DDE superfamily endonuclease
MNLNTLNEFRHEVYGSLTRAAGALFNTVDALLTETSASSFVELSLSPFFERRWASLYEAFEDGRIEGERLRKVMIAHLPQPVAGQRLLLGIDASGIARPQSLTSADRTHLLVHNLPESRTPPITAGWQFSTLMVLPDPVSSWGYILDNQRITSQQTAGEVAAVQLRAAVALLPKGLRPLLTADRYYPNAAFVRATADIACGKLLRSTKRRVFYRPAPPPTGKRGAPRKDGDRFACHDPSTHGVPSAHWEGEECGGHRIEVDAWEHLHLSKAREVELTVIRVTRFGASDKKRDPRVSWFIWIDQEPAPLAEIRPLYQRRFGMEHTYRFQKQELLWEEPRLRTPEQFERWTQIVAIAHNLLVLARPLLQAKRQPWEGSRRPGTPQQVRRAMAPILATLGTPAPAPQLRGKSPGRALGTRITPAVRYRVVKKSKPTPKKRRKSA